jgi:hypothetical protein
MDTDDVKQIRKDAEFLLRNKEIIREALARYFDRMTDNIKTIESAMPRDESKEGLITARGAGHLIGTFKEQREKADRALNELAGLEKED